MLEIDFINKLSDLIGQPIIKSHALSGGDISNVFYLESQNNRFVLKSSNDENGSHLFHCEVLGLKDIKKTNSIAVPEILLHDKIGSTPFILMEYIEPKIATDQDYKTLGEHLAQLHYNTQTMFGWTEDNFIGTLPQKNNHHHSWTDFYINERLLPQLYLAVAKSYLSKSEIPLSEVIQDQLSHLLADIKPSLLHGDLWSGNYLISQDGTPYLIDPSVYYGHHEVDIAMSQLFGGFSNAFYESYHAVFPENKQSSDRIRIYQLYYLLVHLNLFGMSYYQKVKSILKYYFN